MNARYFRATSAVLLAAALAGEYIPSVTLHRECHHFRARHQHSGFAYVGTE